MLYNIIITHSMVLGHFMTWQGYCFLGDDSPKDLYNRLMNEMADTGELSFFPESGEVFVIKYEALQSMRIMIAQPGK